MRGWTLSLVALLAMGCDDGGSTASKDAGGVTTDGGSADTGGETPDGGGPPTDGGAPPDAGGELEAPMAYRFICATCHGAAGEGTPLGYELHHPVVAYTTWVVRNGRPAGGELPGQMSAYADNLVTDADLEEIWAWLESFPQPVDGAGLYADYCRNCHGVDARGGVVGKSAREGAAQIRQLVRSGHGGENYANRRGYMPAFDTDTISDAELDLIVEFLTQ